MDWNDLLRTDAADLFRALESDQLWAGAGDVPGSRRQLSEDDHTYYHATLGQIGKELGISVERVRQIERKALRKLKRNLPKFLAARRDKSTRSPNKYDLVDNRYGEERLDTPYSPPAKKAPPKRDAMYASPSLGQYESDQVGWLTGAALRQAQDYMNKGYKVRRSGNEFLLFTGSYYVGRVPVRSN